MKKLSTTAIPALFFACNLAACSAEDTTTADKTSQALSVSNGTVTAIVGVNAGLCLGVKGSSTASGALLQSQNCNGSAFQQWEMRVGSGGWTEIVNRGSGKCIDVPGASKTGGTNLQQWGCSGADNQKWNVADQSGGEFGIISKSSGMAIEVYEFSTANGARVVQWDWWGGANQKWTLPQAQFQSQSAGPSSGSVITLTGVRAGKCIGVKGSSDASGAQLQSQGCSSSDYQMWQAVRDGSGNYELINVGSGLCMDLPGANPSGGTVIGQWGCSGSAWQKWKFNDDGAGHYYITSVSSGLSLDVLNRSTDNGASIIQWEYWGGDNQQWIVGGSSGSTGGSTDSTPKVSGFAATSSGGLSTTTGGGNAAVETVTSCSQLKSKLEDSTARVVEIPSGTTLDCRTSGQTITACELKCSNSSSQIFWRVPVGTQTCTSLADFNGDSTLDVPAGKAVNKTAYDYQINVNSNKTVRGAGKGATLKGVSFNIQSKSNIIVQNLAITEINPSLIEAGDALTINGSHHVWIDHNKFSMISDGYADIRYGSSAITLSHNEIDGANPYVCGGQHNFISLVTESQATYHHNYFNHVGGRNPKVADSSDVHLYNNYYESVSYFCAAANSNAEVLVENNFYESSRYPHWADGGYIEASGNYYGSGTSSSGRDSNANVFNPPYSYSLESASGLNSSVPAGAGIGKF